MTTDSEIILRSRTQPAAFGEIYERDVAPIGGYLGRRVGADAAEDIVAETFLTAFRKRASFDTSWESARPWLFGIAVRLMRRRRRLEGVQWRAAMAGPADDTAAGDGYGEAEDRMDAQRRLRALEPAIAALAQRDREVLQLFAWGGLSYDDIVASLRVPVGTVRSRLNRVRRQLSNALPSAPVMVGEE